MKRLSKEDKKRLNQAAKQFESDESIVLLKDSSLLTPKEQRDMLGQGKKKLISLRVPEEDLEILKKIASHHKRSYQQLIVQAIESYIDQYSSMAQKKIKT